ncbi:hypothetical protein AcV5_009623 [Taiwanofungus camphoratus]|nr:hypothetical protein AcV5_009623 [Antrodia cinnamomea]
MADSLAPLESAGSPGSPPHHASCLINVIGGVGMRTSTVDSGDGRTTAGEGEGRPHAMEGIALG